MRKLMMLLTAVLLFGTMTLGAAPKKDTKAKVIFTVHIHCDGCIAKIEKNIAFEKGVRDLFIDKQTQTVTVVYNPEKTDVETLKQAFEKIGKPVSATTFPDKETTETR